MAKISVSIDDTNVRVSGRKLGKAIEDLSHEQAKKALAEARLGASGGWPPGGSGGLAGAASGSYTVPERPQQRYVRTGAYGRSVRVERDGGTYKLITDAYSPRGYNYGPRLTGNANRTGQAWWAANRWPVAADEVQKATASLVQDIDKGIDRAAEAVGL